MKGFTGKRVGTSFPITDEECKQIHEAAVRVLEKGGMRCDDPRASKLFEKAGCKVEQDGKLVKIFTGRREIMGLVRGGRIQ